MKQSYGQNEISKMQARLSATLIYSCYFSPLAFHEHPMCWHTLASYIPGSLRQVIGGSAVTGWGLGGLRPPTPLPPLPGLSCPLHGSILTSCLLPSYHHVTAWLARPMAFLPGYPTRCNMYPMIWYLTVAKQQYFVSYAVANVYIYWQCGFLSG